MPFKLCSEGYSKRLSSQHLRCLHCQTPDSFLPPHRVSQPSGWPPRWPHSGPSLLMALSTSLKWSSSEILTYVLELVRRYLSEIALLRPGHWYFEGNLPIATVCIVNNQFLKIGLYKCSKGNRGIVLACLSTYIESSMKGCSSWENESNSALDSAVSCLWMTIPWSRLYSESICWFC